jgi:FimV-like protein
VDVLQRAISRVRQPRPPVRLALAKVYVEANDRDKATAELERVLEAGKSSPYYAPARQLAVIAAHAVSPAGWLRHLGGVGS